MDLVIYFLIGIVAIAVVFEIIKRNKPVKPTGTAESEEEDGPYVSADDSGPTQTGRMKAMPIKNAIQGKDEDGNPLTKGGLSKSKSPSSKTGSKNAINHEKVEATESGGYELPDPFTIELNEDSKE